MNYADLLRQRATQAAPREVQEETASYLQQRNAECLAYWKIRWGMRMVCHDAVAPHWREALERRQALLRAYANNWLRWCMEDKRKAEEDKRQTQEAMRGLPSNVWLFALKGGKI
jgi:hypothetical protein